MPPVELQQRKRTAMSILNPKIDLHVKGKSDDFASMEAQTKVVRAYSACGLGRPPRNSPRHHVALFLGLAKGPLEGPNGGQPLRMLLCTNLSLSIVTSLFRKPGLKLFIITNHQKVPCAHTVAIVKEKMHHFS